jgi:hypothetical protein
VQIETQIPNLCVEIWVPCEIVVDRDLACDNEASVTPKPKSGNMFLLERSVSGLQEHLQIACEFLPPIMLSVVLPMQYPSADKPLFSLSCFWLNKSQLSALCLELDRIWDENRNMLVVFTWVKWLQEKTLEFLDIFEQPNKVMVRPVATMFEPNLNDSRALNEFNDIQNCIYNFLR